MNGRHLLGSVLAAVAVATSLSLGTVQVAAATSCRPAPGSEACLSYLFADGGAHFNATVWQADIMKAEGTTPGLDAKFHRLITKAKTQAQKTKVVQWFLTAIHGGGTQPGSGVPSWAMADRMCHKVMPSVGFKYAKSVCQSWYGNFAIVTGWKMWEGDNHTQIDILGYPQAQPNDGPNLAVLDFPGWVKMPDTAAWTAEDSPLPLIAWFQTMRHQRFDPGALHLKPTQAGTLGDKESAAATQFLAFWGWGYAPVFFSTGVRHLMADAGFNPIMAGGPNLPFPAKAWPAWTSRALHPVALRASGWLYTTWPEACMSPSGVPILFYSFDS